MGQYLLQSEVGTAKRANYYNSSAVLKTNERKGEEQ